MSLNTTEWFAKLLEKIEDLKARMDRFQASQDAIFQILQDMQREKDGGKSPFTHVTPEKVSQSFVDKIEEAFPRELRDMLNFTDEVNYVKIVPRQYLGSENFSKVALIIRGMDGEYVSAGRESHFKVSKKA